MGDLVKARRCQLLVLQVLSFNLSSGGNTRSVRIRFGHFANNNAIFDADNVVKIYTGMWSPDNLILTMATCVGDPGVHWTTRCHG